MRAFDWESQTQEKLEEINLDFVRAKYWSMLRTIVKTVVGSVLLQFGQRRPLHE